MSRAAPEYHDDQLYDDAEVVHQPEAYEVARYLMGATGRGTVIDIGCGSGRKLRSLSSPRAIGIDFGHNIAFCRTAYPDFGEWVEIDLSDPSARLAASYAGLDAIVICADVVEHLPDPSPLVKLLEDCYRRGAIVITTTPDRLRVRGPEDSGPPANPSHVREWQLDEYAAVIADAGLGLTYVGYTINNSEARELKTILTLSDPDVGCHAVRRNPVRPLAIIAAYNEADMLDELVSDWIDQGSDVHLIDNWSTDGTWEAARRWATNQPARVTAERFPESPSATYEWLPILHRKADIAARHPGRWIIHSDADEIRRSPFPGVNLADALDLVGECGANRVDFRVVNFRPTDASEPLAGNIQHSLRCFDFGTRPGHLQQAKAWLQGSARVDLASTGGHEARFKGATDFRYKFLLKHYPLRSQAHARRKIEQERHARRSSFESGILGYHAHYDRVAKAGFEFVREPHLLDWNDESFWRDHGLLILTDLLKSRVDRGWMEGDK